VVTGRPSREVSRIRFLRLSLRVLLALVLLIGTAVGWAVRVARAVWVRDGRRALGLLRYVLVSFSYIGIRVAGYRLLSHC
jgi:hypothetical protein